MKRFVPLTLLALLFVATGCDSSSEDDTVTVQGIIENVTGLGVDDATLTFAGGESDRTFTASTDGDGNFTIEVPAGTYTVTIEAPGYTTATTETDTGAGPLNLTLRGPAVVSGRIVGSQDGAALGEGRVSFTRGSGADVDTSQAAIDLEASLDAEGNFHIDGAPTGTFLLVVRAPGFLPSVIPNVDFEEGETDLGETTAVEAPPAGAYRIVLTWGERPRDLDSHLTGPDGQGGRFHVYYVTTSFEDIAELDRDDVTSFGPETVTLTPSTDGMYRYSVFNFSDQGEDGSQGIAGEVDDSIPARVQVYTDQGLFREYRAPASTPGNTWRIFEMNVANGNVTVTDVNEYVEASGSGDISVFRMPPK